MIRVPKWALAKGEEFAQAYTDYVKVAQRADKRLERLEKYTEQTQTKSAMKWAYGKAAHDIEKWDSASEKFNSEKPRYNRNIPRDINALKKRTQEVESFLETKTSTPTGITSAYDKMQNTFKEKHGLNLSKDEIGRLFESGAFDKMRKSKVESTSIVKAIAEYKMEKEKLKTMIDDALSNNLYADDEQKAITQALKRSNVSLKKLSEIATKGNINLSQTTKNILKIGERKIQKWS